MSNAVAASQLSHSQQDLQDLVTLALAEARGLGQRLLWYLWKLANPALVRQARGNVARDRYS